jgi:hypothetical protein
VQFGKETDLTDPVAGALPSPQLIVAVKLGGFEDPVLVKVAGQTVADSVKCPARPSMTRPCTVVGKRLRRKVVVNPVPAALITEVWISVVVPFPMSDPTGLSDPRVLPPT